MKIFNKKIIALMVCLTSAIVLFSINVSAASLFQPYGYSLPLKTLAEDPSSLKSNNYISGIDLGVRSYEEDTGFVWSPRSSSMLCITLGANNYGLDSLIQAASAGKINTKITFCLNPTVNNPNKPTNPINYLDLDQDVKIKNGNFIAVGYKYYYGWSNNYAVDFKDIAGSGNQRVNNLYYGKFYTYICEIDVEAGTIYQCFKDYETGDVVGERTVNTQLECVRNGARARFMAMWDVKMKEFSCYRETFSIKDSSIKANDSEVTAQMQVALDCSKNAEYGEINTTSPVLVLCQYDKNGLMLGYDTKSIGLSLKEQSALTNNYETVSISMKKNPKYDHAYAYIWNNTDDMFAYCSPLLVK